MARTASEDPVTATANKIPLRMQVKYRDKVVPALQKEFGYKNPMMVPRLLKVVVNMGVGQAVQNKARIEAANKDLTAIVGQKPMIRKARQSVASFKLREGYPIGVAVTLRGPRMWEFVDRLISLAIPRIRDFRGLPTKAFDGRGNYSLGVREQLIFPEIDYDKVDRIRGMQINICTSAPNDEEGRRLLELMGMPFAKGN